MFEPPLRFEELRPQSLQRHLDPKLEVEGLPHLAHPTAPEHLEDLVPLAEYLARSESPQPLRHVEGLTLAFGAGGEVVVSHRLALGASIATETHLRYPR